MKPLIPFQKSVLLIIVFTATIGYWGCKKDDSKNSESNPDVIIEYDTTVGGFFEGDETPEFPADIEPDIDLDTHFKDKTTNSISDAEINQAPDFSMEKFAAAYDAVLTEFPDIDQKSNEFAEKIIKKIAQFKKMSVFSNNDHFKMQEAFETLTDIYDPLSDLTPEEKYLVLRNPIYAYKSKIAANNAMETTFSLFGENGYKTRSDAFRHSYWNWLMCQSCSVEWARAFATAHESQTPNNDDRRMDLNNNMIGRRVFSSNPSASEVEAQNTLLDYKLLWINEEQKNVVVGIDYLVYLSPVQSLTVFDDGPEYDDIYDILLNGSYLGTTPQGGSRAFIFSQITSGTHNLDIRCQLDGTNGGCGFEIILKGALMFISGQNQTPQIVIQESDTHSVQIIFPVMKARRID